MKKQRKNKENPGLPENTRKSVQIRPPPSPPAGTHLEKTQKKRKRTKNSLIQDSPREACLEVEERKILSFVDATVVFKKVSQEAEDERRSRRRKKRRWKRRWKKRRRKRKPKRGIKKAC